MREERRVEEWTVTPLLQLTYCSVQGVFDVVSHQAGAVAVCSLLVPLLPLLLLCGG